MSFMDRITEERQEEQEKWIDAGITRKDLENTRLNVDVLHEEIQKEMENSGTEREKQILQDMMTNLIIHQTDPFQQNQDFISLSSLVDMMQQSKQRLAARATYPGSGNNNAADPEQDAPYQKILDIAMDMCQRPRIEFSEIPPIRDGMGMNAPF